MIHEQQYTDGVSCDGTNCTTTIRGEQMSIWRGYEYYRGIAVAAGWTYWAGRTNRQYGPCHQPVKGHKMRLIAGTPPSEKEETQ